ncbi:MAG TPA: divergent polysaccharide deacetylase family protein [Alphaproteobacteria bacterium]
MMNEDDIDAGEDGEGQSLPSRIYTRLMGSPLLTGLTFGVVILIALMMVFAGTGHAPVTQPDPTVVDISAEALEQASDVKADPEKPQILSEDSAPSGAVPVVAEVALVVTDVGLSRRVSEAVIKQLPRATTIAVSPYATNPPATLAAYKSAGNDVWLQLATRSTKVGLDPGPLAMSTALANNENQNYLQQQLAQAGSGFVGLFVPSDADITMGADAWKTMALDLIGKNLMIMDATTAKVATELYVPQDTRPISAYLKADAIVPGDLGATVLKQALADTIPTILREREAIIVLNHPTVLAIAQTTEWLKTLRNQGIALVPASKFTGLKP